MGAMGDAGQRTDFSSEVFPELRAPSGPLPLQGHFSTVLQWALTKLDSGDPEVLPHFVHHTQDFAVMYDGYPKSEVHLLVMPRARINSARSLSKEPLLRSLAAYTAWVLESVAKQRPELTLRHGVHAGPSLLQLHVHVLSQDFRSPCLKNKKHFNSFQPPFLVPLPHVLAELEASGSVAGAKAAEETAWLKRDLVCSGCGKEFGNKFAELRQHLVSCPPPPSAPPPWPLESGGGAPGLAANAAAGPDRIAASDVAGADHIGTDKPGTARPGPLGAWLGRAGGAKRPRDEDFVDLCDD